MDTGTLLLLMFVIFVFLIVSLFGLAIYSGLLYAPVISTGRPVIGECMIAYKFVQGPYKTCVGSVFTEVTSIAPDRKCIGIYYDDPCEVSDEWKLRSAIGCILAERSSDDDAPEKKCYDLFVKNGFQFVSLPSIDLSVNSLFPHTTAFSIYFAVGRVYPLIRQFIKDNQLVAGPCIEIYDDDKMYFMSPLSNQKAFQVPEFLATETSPLETEQIRSEDVETLEADVSNLSSVSGDRKGPGTRALTIRHPRRSLSSSPDSGPGHHPGEGGVVRRRVKRGSNGSHQMLSSTGASALICEGKSGVGRKTTRHGGNGDKEELSDESDTTETSASSFEELCTAETDEQQKLV